MTAVAGLDRHQDVARVQIAADLEGQADALGDGARQGFLDTRSVGLSHVLG